MADLPYGILGPSGVQSGGGMLTGSGMGGTRPRKPSILDGMLGNLLAPATADNAMSMRMLENMFSTGKDTITPTTGLGEAFEARQVMQARAKEMEAFDREQQQAEQERQALRSTFEQKAPDLLPWLDAGQADYAMAEYERRNQPAGGLDPTAAMQEYQYAVGQGYDGSFADWKAGGTPQTTINNNIGGTDEFYGQLDKNLATQTSDAITAGMNAQSNNVRLGELETLLQTAPQGAAGAMTQIAGNLGIPTEGLDEVQAAQALINQMVPGQRPPGSGTMSDADLALFKASLPQIINQPGGNQKILATMKAINEYTIAQAQIAQAVANRQITPAQGREMQMQVPNPLAGIQTTTPMTPAQNDPLGIR